MPIRWSFCSWESQNIHVTYIDSSSCIEPVVPAVDSLYPGGDLGTSEHNNVEQMTLLEHIERHDILFKGPYINVGYASSAGRWRMTNDSGMASRRRLWTGCLTKLQETMHTREKWHGKDEGGNFIITCMGPWRTPELQWNCEWVPVWVFHVEVP